VVNGRDASVSLVDPGSGRVLGALPVPHGTLHVVPGRLGPDEGLVALAAPAGSLTHLRRTGRGGAWASRPVAPEPDAVVQSVAGDGARHAAAAYALRSRETGRVGAACRLAHIDLPSGRVERTLPVCGGPPDAIEALALARSPEGPVAYVALGRRAASGAPEPGGGRLAALHLATGAVLASAPLPGAPEQVLLAPAPEGAGRRLYAVTADPGTVDTGAPTAQATEWRITGFDPVTLRAETEQRLPYRPLWLGVAPDGRRAYAVAGPANPPGPSGLLRVDLVGGGASLLPAAPGRVMGLAVTGDRLFLADPEGSQLWVLDHGARPVRTIRVGQRPLWLALSSP
jgi:hypothetical protein